MLNNYKKQQNSGIIFISIIILILLTMQFLSSNNNKLSSIIIDEFKKTENAVEAIKDPVFIPPITPDWFSQNLYNLDDLKDEPTDELFAEALQLYSEKRYEKAYYRFLLSSKAGINAAHVYLGLLLSNGAVPDFPRQALHHHYEALKGAGHVTSYLELARALDKGTLVQRNKILSAQYFARVLNHFGDDKKNTFYIEADEYLKSLSSDNYSAATLREKDLLDQYKPGHGETNLVSIVKVLVDEFKQFQAPGKQF